MAGIKKKTNRGKRRTKAQINALRREVEGHNAIGDLKSATAKMIGVGTSSSEEVTTAEIDGFPLFAKLPTELKLKIFEFAFNRPRYISMSPCNSDSIIDMLQMQIISWVGSYPRGFVFCKNQWPDHSGITYLPLSKNYTSTLQVNKAIREEGLKSFQLVNNDVRKLSHPNYIYINYGSDLMIVDMEGAWSGYDRQFFKFLQVTKVLQTRETQLQRLVVPMLDARVPYMSEIRQGLPNLRELCFFNEKGDSGLDITVHKCRHTEMGNPTVLVDISDYWPANLIGRFAGNFCARQMEFEEEKKLYPDWKLEKLRLVSWAAEKKHGEGMDFGLVKDVHNNGIYERIKEHQHDETATGATIGASQEVDGDIRAPAAAAADAR